MSRLVRLYPQAWRDRYEDEFVALLEERPPTLGDVLDTIRGALDAHLHPSVGEAEPGPWTHRVPGLFAVVAGLLWSGLVLYQVLRPDLYYESGTVVSLFMFAVFFSLPGDYMAAHGRQIAVGIGAAALSYMLAHIAGWNHVGFGFLALATLLLVCGPLVLAGIRAGIGPGGRWLLLVLAVVVPIFAAVGISAIQNITNVVLVPEQTRVSLLLLLPYGLAWLFVGLRLTIRGAPTFVYNPPDVAESEPEVRPA